VAPLIREELERTGGKLVSLFYGTGAIERIVGGDQVAAEKSLDLRALFAELQADARGLADAFAVYAVARERTAERYLEARHWPVKTQRERAIRFLFVSAQSFNGLWRVNGRGEPNMACDPARLAHPWPFPSSETLLRTGRELAPVRFLREWEWALALAKPGDVILADPPYLGGFTGYTEHGFPLEVQFHLAEELRRAVERGCALVAFNSAGAAPLYSWAHLEQAQHRARMSSKPGPRREVTELLITAGLGRSMRRVA
jgi:site-specific DNA-adenine methylase